MAFNLLSIFFLLRAWGVLLAVRLALWCFGAHKTAGFLLRHQNRSRQGEIKHWKSQAQLLQRVSRWVPGALCMARSVALCYLGRRAGVRLCVGVRGATRTLEAHAWCELAGVVLNDEASIVQSFKRVPFPGSALPGDAS